MTSEKPLRLSPCQIGSAHNLDRMIFEEGSGRCINLPISPESVARPLRLMFLARSLGIGGAERQLAELATRLAQRGHDVTVATFYPQNVHREMLEQSGVRLYALGKRSRWHLASFLTRLARSVVGLRPDIVYSFLPVPNILATLPRLVLPRHGLVWGVRASELPAGRYDALSHLALRLESALARVPDLIITNSRAGRRHAVRRGFPRDRLAVVPNGIDVERFRPAEADQRLAARAAFGIPPGAIAVGTVARLDPMKDHEGFLRAVALAAGQRDVRAIIAGTGPGPEIARLRALAESLGIGNRITWAGPVLDVRAVYVALDVLCVASAYGEGFPNVLGEAMACGVPCVVTDIGDAAQILDDLGPVLPPGDPATLAAALLDAFDRARRDASLSAQLRVRIVENYGVAPMVSATERLLFDLRARIAP